MMYDISTYGVNSIPAFLWDMLNDTQRQELTDIFYRNMKNAVEKANYSGPVTALAETTLRRICDNISGHNSADDFEKIIAGIVKSELVKMKLTYI